ncbi:MAG: hypothetical protein D6781_11900 [Verrucomicrobia bacterium]|nr:MAG: hypothetical protein D6781_11900 [Verrucomicrobiota bacterium]
MAVTAVITSAGFVRTGAHARATTSADPPERVNRLRAEPRLPHDDKTTVLIDRHCRKAPRGEVATWHLVAAWLAVFVEQSPLHRATPSPARTLHPGDEHLAGLVRGDGRVFRFLGSDDAAPDRASAGPIETRQLDALSDLGGDKNSPPGARD